LNAHSAPHALARSLAPLAGTKKEELAERCAEWLVTPSLDTSKHGGKPVKKKPVKRAAPKSPKKKAKKAKREEDSEGESEPEAADSDDDYDAPLMKPDLSGAMTSAKLKAWVGHYVACMDVETITVNEAMKACEGKFKQDLADWKKEMKALLIANM
jgi:hypothetical protein